VTRGRRDLPLPLFIVGIVLFGVALVTGERVVYGIADLLIGASIGLYAAQGAPPLARNAQLYQAGLVIAAAGAVLDGIFTLADQSSIAGTLTWAVVVGALVALVGYGPVRR
jgi:hypothetical protein